MSDKLLRFLNPAVSIVSIVIVVIFHVTTLSTKLAKMDERIEYAYNHAELASTIPYRVQAVESLCGTAGADVRTLLGMPERLQRVEARVDSNTTILNERNMIIAGMSQQLNDICARISELRKEQREMLDIMRNSR